MQKRCKPRTTCYHDIIAACPAAVKRSVIHSAMRSLGGRHDDHQRFHQRPGWCPGDFSGVSIARAPVPLLAPAAKTSPNSACCRHGKWRCGCRDGKRHTAPSCSLTLTCTLVVDTRPRAGGIATYMHPRYASFDQIFTITMTPRLLWPDYSPGEAS